MSTGQPPTTPAEGVTDRPAEPGRTVGGSGGGPQQPARASNIDWGRLITNYAAVGVLLGFIVFFSLAEPETFPTTDTAKSIVTSESVLAILALGAIIPLIVGEFDLSIANNLAFSAVLTAKFVSEGMSVPLALALVCAAGMVIGLVNAFLILKIGVSSFIATLGTSVILAGLTSAIAGGATIFEGIDESLTDLGNSELLSIPVGGFYVLIVAAILWYVLAFTPLGRHMYATGYGRAAAQLAGIRTSRLITLSFVLAGLLGAVAGALHCARVGSASPGVGGSFLLPAFAAAFLGATTIRAGRFNVWGTILGVVLLAVGITGLRLMGVPQYAQDLFNGTALIVAVGLAAVGTRRAKAGATAPA